MKTEKKGLNVQVPIEMAQEVDRIAKKRNISASQVVRMCLDIGLGAHRDFERCGLIFVLDFSHYVKTAVREKLKDNVKGNQLSLPL